MFNSWGYSKSLKLKRKSPKLEFSIINFLICQICQFSHNPCNNDIMDFINFQLDSGLKFICYFSFYRWKTKVKAMQLSQTTNLLDLGSLRAALGTE